MYKSCAKDVDHSLHRHERELSANRFLIFKKFIIFACILSPSLGLHASESNDPLIEITGTIHLLPIGCGDPQHEGPESTLIVVDEQSLEIVALDGVDSILEKIQMGSRVRVKGSFKTQGQTRLPHQGPRILTYTHIEEAGAPEE